MKQPIHRKRATELDPKARRFAMLEAGLDPEECRLCPATPPGDPCPRCGKIAGFDAEMTRTLK